MYFVKAPGPGDLTQRNVSGFAKQVPNRVYETMAFEVAHEGVRLQKEKWQISTNGNNQTISTASIQWFMRTMPTMLALVWDCTGSL